MLIIEWIIIVLRLLVHIHGILLPLICLHIKSLAIGFDVVDYINIGAVDVLEGTLLGVEANAYSLIDTDYFYSITWFHKINQVLIGTQMYGLWSFTFRYRLWRLLHLYMLLITKH